MDLKHLKQPVWLHLWGSLGVTVASMLILFGIFPYGSGYGGNTQSVFWNLWWMWKHMAEWEHCMFVPLIVAGLIYHKRQDVLQAEISPDARLGGVLLGFSVLCFWIGYQIDIVPFSFLTIHLTLGSLIIWFMGWSFMRVILFPFAFLIFAWPFPFLDSLLAFPLRILMSDMSHHFLNLISIDNVKIGTAILSAPDFERGIAQGERFSLDVANPCSGIRSLFALIMVTALYAYFSVKKTWKQWALFACAAPLAVFGNFGRILMLTFGTLLFGNDFAVGSETDPSGFHMASGFFVFAVALGGMVGIAFLLNRKVPDEIEVKGGKILR